MDRGRTSVLTVTLTPAERATLERWQRSPSLPAALVRRARCVLLRAGGRPIWEIAQWVGPSRKAVYHARWAWQAAGLAGLAPRRRGRPPAVPDLVWPDESLYGY